MVELLEKRQYMRQFDFYRVMTFLMVIGQHAVLWPVTPSSPVGWALVDFLHATREIFFVLSCLVATYAQHFEKRGVIEGIRKRLGSIFVPYATWTIIYFVYSIVATHLTRDQMLPSLWLDAYKGYYQLYYLVVLAQIFVLLPLLWWIVDKTRGHHWKLFSAAVAWHVAMMSISHYGTSWGGGVPKFIRHYDIDLMASRYPTGYLLYIFAGILVAVHLDEVQAFVERFWRQILVFVGLVFVVVETIYGISVAGGSAPGYESDLYQPLIVLWSLSAAGGVWTLGWRWSVYRNRCGRTRVNRMVEWFADASEGYYLAHIFFLQLAFIMLETLGLNQYHDWATMSAAIYPLTLLWTGVFIWLAQKTPVRFALTGINRTKQRQLFSPYPPDGVEAELVSVS